MPWSVPRIDIYALNWTINIKHQYSLNKQFKIARCQLCSFIKKYIQSQISPPQFKNRFLSITHHRERNKNYLVIKNLDYYWLILSSTDLCRNAITKQSGARNWMRWSNRLNESSLILRCLSNVTEYYDSLKWSK